MIAARIDLRIAIAAGVAAAWLAGAPFAGARAQSEPSDTGLETAIFAGGCFWCVESDFDGVPGVVDTQSGYAGGHTENPTYKDVTYGDTGHREAVRIRFDPTRVSYAELVEVFWRSVDPSDAGGQFCDRGSSYTTAIFASSEAQRATAESSKRALERSGRLGRPIVTPIEMVDAFYPAEDYHQDYYRKNPVRYRVYRYGCRRDARLADLWGDEAHRGIENH